MRMRKLKMTKREKRECAAGYAFVGPQLFGLAVFVAFPIAFSLYLCFAEWNMIDMPTWNGFSNFKAAFTDRIFWKSILNTLLYIIIVVPSTLVISLLLAILTNRKMPLKRFIRACLFLPMITSTVAIAMVWTYMFQGEGGILNSFLTMLGVKNPPNWLQDTTFARIAVSIVSIWLKIGYYYIIFDAGIKNIPKELYEAADIDGASSWRKLIRITIPELSNVMFFVLVMLFIDVFNMFNEVYIMTAGGPDYSTYSLSMYIYFYAFQQGDMGRAAVASWVLFALVGIITFIQFRVRNKTNKGVAET